MMQHETRRCLKCGHMMHVVEGSDRTTRDRVWFTLRCNCCGHVELDWYERPAKGKSKF